MLIGIPREIKNHEYRVGLTASGARELSARGHQVLVERDAGVGIGLANEAFEAAGAQIVDSAAEVYGRAEMIIKVKEPQPAEVMVIGAGTVGLNAARMAMGLGAHVTVLDRSLDRLKYVDELYGERLTTIYSTRDAIEDRLPYTDLVVGAVLIPGAAAPKLLSRGHLKLMRPGSVLVDVAIDQGGCFETSRPTTHQEPTYEVDGIIHYCVANMPGGVARTSTFALTNATLPHALALADKGAVQALLDDVNLRNGLNVHAGKLTYRAVADALNLPFTPAAEALSL